MLLWCSAGAVVGAPWGLLWRLGNIFGVLPFPECTSGAVGEHFGDSFVPRQCISWGRGCHVDALRVLLWRLGNILRVFPFPDGTLVAVREHFGGATVPRVHFGSHRGTFCG